MARGRKAGNSGRQAVEQPRKRKKTRHHDVDFQRLPRELDWNEDSDHSDFAAAMLKITTDCAKLRQKFRRSSQPCPIFLDKRAIHQTKVRTASQGLIRLAKCCHERVADVEPVIQFGKLSLHGP